MDGNFKLTAIISTIRHGEKDKSGNLTTEGVKQGATSGANNKSLEGNVVILHSGVDRVKDTVLSFVNYLGKANEVKNIDTLNKDIELDHFVSHYLQYLYDPKKKGELFGKWDEVSGGKEIIDRMNNFLNQKEISSEPEIYPSPKKMAVRLARVIATEIDFATITVPEVRTNFVNRTHEPVIMAFLYYFLQNFAPTSDNFIQEIGGTVGYCDGFNIEIYQNISHKNLVLFKFRDKEIEVDQLN